jgi:hypothetical protein
MAGWMEDPWRSPAELAEKKQLHDGAALAYEANQSGCASAIGQLTEPSQALRETTACRPVNKSQA